MKKRLSYIVYSFPVQLLFLHLRNHLLLLGTWVLTVLLLFGAIGDTFGVRYLFLTPEYLSRVDFWSFFWVGLAFGGFFMSWNLASYILSSHYFPFLASMQRPFTKFCINNSVIPIVFIIIYLLLTIGLQWNYEYWEANTIFLNCFGFLGGWALSLMIFAIYFTYTNKDILSFIKKRRRFRPPNLARSLIPGRRGLRPETITDDNQSWTVKTYLNESFKPRVVRSVAHYDSKLLMKVFKQNHTNAIVVMVFSILLLLGMGYMIDHPWFRIPAAASYFILMAMFVSIGGSILYWLHQWRTLFIIVFLVGLNAITKHDSLKHTNKAYGLNYTSTFAKYNNANLQKISSPRNQAADKQNTIAILEAWKARFPKGTKPKMVLFSGSGGGMRAGVWAMQVLQHSDKALDGKLFKHLTLMTGASGGGIGMAYMRELYYRNQLQNLDHYNKEYINKLAKDMLNPVFFTLVSNDLFLPWAKFKDGNYTYRKDRGYIFERAFHENTDSLMMRRLKDYKEAEQKAQIPLLFITPSIVNDGRRLIISPQPVSYMMRPPSRFSPRTQPDFDAVDFGRLFESQDGYNLQMGSAIRMNATYPYILPNVYLPTEPSIEIIDSGFRDNYGLVSTARFIHVFSDWIKTNTSGVVVVKVTGWDRTEYHSSSDGQGAIESMLNPLGIFGQLSQLQAYEHDSYFSLLNDLLGETPIEVLDFIYRPSKAHEKASMNFHLSNREQFDIMKAIYQKDNQANLKRLKDLLD